MAKRRVSLDGGGVAVIRVGEWSRQATDLIVVMTPADPGGDYDLGELSDVLSEILEGLKVGPQWPRTLALKLGATEGELLPYLADLAAREWVTIVVPSGEVSADDPLVQRVEVLQDEFAESTTPEELEHRQQKWLSLLRTAAVAPRLCVALTAKGQEANEHFEVVGHS